MGADNCYDSLNKDKSGWFISFLVKYTKEVGERISFKAPMISFETQTKDV